MSEPKKDPKPLIIKSPRLHEDELKELERDTRQREEDDRYERQQMDSYAEDDLGISGGFF